MITPLSRNEFQEYVEKNAIRSDLTNAHVLVFTVSEFYCKYYSVALSSFVSNTSRTRNYEIILLTRDLTKENEIRLSSYLPNNVKLKVVKVDGIYESLFGSVFKTSNNMARLWTVDAMFSLLIPIIFSERKKVIFFDSDVIFLRNIDELLDVDFGNNIIMGV